MRAFFRLAGGMVAGIAAAAMLAATGGEALAVAGASESPAVGLGNNYLASVAVTSASNAWAVGWVSHGSPARTLTERWNGSAWKIVKTPSPGGTTGQGHLYGVAARSSTAWAVGQYWNGKALQTLTEHWNGTAWKVVPSPDPAGSARTNYLNKVAYISRSQAWAVGDYSTGKTDQAMAERWNGRAWKVVPTPHLAWSYLDAIAVVSPDDAWAVGQYSTSRTLIEHWNGKAWTRVPSPDPGNGGQNLEAVTAVSRSNAWAVGYYKTGAALKTLVLHWNGRSWRRVASPDPGGFNYDALLGVTASSSRAWAVGNYSSAVDTYQTLILRWNGRFWAQAPSPSPSPATNVLRAVAMTSTAAPWAVGQYGTGSPGLTLTEHWTGSGWTQVTSPNR